MELWLIGPESGKDFAGSAYTRIVLDHLGGRPEAVTPDIGNAVVAHATRLAYLVPVLHDVSAGGLAVAVAEICIRSGVGAAVAEPTWELLLDEAPSRFLAVVPPGADLGIHDVPARRIGVMGGDEIDFGSFGSLPLDDATRVWREAIPRRMDHISPPPAKPGKRGGGQRR